MGLLPEARGSRAASGGALCGQGGRGESLGTGIGAKCAFTDVEVVRGDAGVPSILLHGAAGVTARELGITGWFLTMTHSGLSAAATVIALAQ